ncbi:hypothetical protein Pcinc_015600 [Petrolisthes cinctipes]|uniref:Uncharacterized protein n=1 Tax=Petrolisthes cinctipes TaxID=88211 RepID=A0AAE1FTZ5_PETCI|nr:hypothetical protein Pcinc_015600 [Petrolisthes cinctipes]
MDEAVVSELLEPDETSAENMIEDNELEVMAEEEKNTKAVKENTVTAGYLSRKITDLAQMKDYLCGTGSLESEWNGGKLQITAGITMRDGEVISDLVKSATLNRYLDTFKYKLVLTSLLETFPYLLEGLPIDDALVVSKTVNIWNIANYLPPTPPTEDDASIERHIMQLKEQHKRLEGKRDATIIADAMLTTLSERRSLVVKRCARLQDVQVEYPILFSENEVCS